MPRPFHLVEVESWPECREIIIEGVLDGNAEDRFEDCLRRAEESSHDQVLIDFGRCESIDVVAVKQLIVLRELLAAQGRELLVFGDGQVRLALQRIGAFDGDIEAGGHG